MQATPFWLTDASPPSHAADVIIDPRHPESGATQDPHADDIIIGAETEGAAIISARTAAGVILIAESEAYSIICENIIDLRHRRSAFAYDPHAEDVIIESDT